MKKLYGITLFILILFSVSEGFGQTEGYNFVGAGARSAGMAYAFISVADDATAISWNPAGLAQLRKPEISFAGEISLNKFNYTEGFWDDYSYNNLTPSYLGVVFPVSLKSSTLAFGAAYNTIINYSYRLEYVSYYKYQYSSKRSMLNAISLSASYQYSFIYFGVSMNNYFTHGKGYELVADTAYSDWSYSYKSKFSGLNLNIGVLFNFKAINQNFPFKLGFRISTPYNLKEERTYSGRYTGNSTHHSEFPIILGAGVSYRIGEYLLLSADFDYRPFKDKKQKYLYNRTDVLDGDTHYDSGENGMIDGNYNMHQFRIGAEYIFHAKKVYFPVRIGYKNNPTQFADYTNLNTENDNIDIYGDQVKGSSINWGFGVKYDFFAIDFAYEFFTYTKAYNYIYEDDPDRNRSFKAKYRKNTYKMSVIFYL